MLATKATLSLQPTRIHPMASVAYARRVDAIGERIFAELLPWITWRLRSQSSPVQSGAETREPKQ